jgi:PhnB protein
MQVTPYLDFGGRCEEAIEFYKKSLDAKVGMMMRFKESPDKNMCAPGSEDKIMHAALRIGDSEVFASDGPMQGKPEFKGIALAIGATNVADAERMFNALAAGGKVNVPLSKTFFAERFGMVADKFGGGWLTMAGPTN